MNGIGFRDVSRGFYVFLTCSRLITTCVWCVLLFFIREAAFYFYRLYWFHQWGIPYRYCRFYWFLAGAVEERQGISIPYPSPTPLLTPLGNPLRRGILAAAVDRDSGFLYPVRSLFPSSGFCVAVCVRLCIVRVSVGLSGLCRSFFIGGEADRLSLRLRLG